MHHKDSLQHIPTAAQQGAAPDRLQLRFFTSLASSLRFVATLSAAGELNRWAAARGLAVCKTKVTMAQSIFYRLLHKTQPATFQSDFGIDESVKRLSAIVRRWPPILPLQKHLVGSVKMDKVIVARKSNGFAPVFHGAFHVRDGSTVLEGYFALSLYTRILMSFWFGFVILMTFVSAFVVIGGRPIYTNRPMAQWQAQLMTLLIPCLMLAFGLVLVLVSKWFARNDVSIISQKLQLAMRADN